jgi:hypothetical protein
MAGAVRIRTAPANTPAPARATFPSTFGAQPRAAIGAEGAALSSLDGVFAIAALARANIGVDRVAAGGAMANRRLRPPVVQVVTPRHTATLSHASRIAPAELVFRAVVESATLSMGSCGLCREPSNSAREP